MKRTALFLFLSLQLNFVFPQKDINQLDVDSLKTGVWMKFYKNGNLRYKGQFKKGKEYGVFKFYSEYYSNHPIVIKTFNELNDSCSVQFFYITGIRKAVGQMDGRKKTGQWLFYDNTGEKILMEENYHNDLLHGLKKTYYSNGNLTVASHYKQGVLHGSYERYTESGVLIEKLNYDTGHIHGPITYYNQNGVIRETGFYHYGKRVGKWVLYIDGKPSKVTEPNKKKSKKPITLEELNRRKEARKKE